MSNQSNWLEVTPEGIVLRILIQPRAAQNKVIGIQGEPPRLKLQVAAPPLDGEANEELLRFVKKKIQVKGARYCLIRGQTSKFKDILCSGVTFEEIELKLLSNNFLTKT
jgi:uncharacterized protein (TIGR00251 family)